MSQLGSQDEMANGFLRYDFYPTKSTQYFWEIKPKLCA